MLHHAYMLIILGVSTQVSTQMATTPIDEWGGYNYQFVNTPSVILARILVCMICQYPSREPHLSVCCGHTFCESCLKVAAKMSASQTCPVCRSEKFITVPNLQVDRAIRSLHVFCTNKDKGCEWQGEVNDITNHLGNSDGCQFEEVACSNDCGKCLQRQNLTNHVEDECVHRKVDCQYCHIVGEHQFIEGEHKEQCPKFPIACPNKCQADNILRENIDEHRKMCPLEQVTCPNDCGISLQQQHLTSHVEDECVHRKVNCQYCHLAGEHQFIEGEHKEQCPKLPIDCPNKCDIGSVPRDDVEEHMKMCPLELIQCEYHVVGCEERMARKDQKKHNKEKIEDHLAYVTYQLIRAQNSLVSAVNSREELKTKITQTGNDLTTTKQLLFDAIRMIDRLRQRPLETEKDIASQMEKTKVELNMKLEWGQNESKKELVAARDELTHKLINTERDLNTAKQQLSTICHNVEKAKKEHITLATNTDEGLAKLETKFQTKITEIETAAQERIIELETKLEKKLTKQEQETKMLEAFISVGKDTLQHYSEISKTALKLTLSSDDQIVPVVVQMYEFAEKKKDWYSKPFFSHQKGYKMCLRVLAPGWLTTSSTSHVSVWLYLMKGPYDDQLRWPMKGHCEVKLLNQVSNSEHHLGNGKYNDDNGHKRVTNMIKNDRSVWYSWKFVSHDLLYKSTQKCQYLKDDSIFLQVDYKLH